jgi:heme-degrading monooxygenase HmoA
LITISKRNSILTGIIYLTVPIEKLQWMFDFNVNETEQKIKHLPGFLSATFLKSLDGTRVFEYVQWESLEHFQAALKNPLFAEHTTQVREAGEDDVDLYEVYYVDQRGVLPDHNTSITISLAQEPATIITHFKTTQNQQQALLDILVEHHERELRHLPGFVSVSFHQGVSGERVVEYLQFRNIEEFDVAQAHPISKAHRAACEKYATPDLHVYTVGATIEAPPTTTVQNS